MKVTLLLVLLLAGCVTPYRTRSTGFTGFLAYEGPQSRWPTSASALTQVDFTLPVYLGVPAKTYRVVGFVVSAEPLGADQKLPGWLWTDETRLANACNLAKEHGADAVVLTNDPALVNMLKPEVGRSAESYRLLTNFDGVIVAIKWMERR